MRSITWRHTWVSFEHSKTFYLRKLYRFDRAWSFLFQWLRFLFRKSDICRLFLLIAIVSTFIKWIVMLIRRYILWRWCSTIWAPGPSQIKFYGLYSFIFNLILYFFIHFLINKQRSILCGLIVSTLIYFNVFALGATLR